MTMNSRRDVVVRKKKLDKGLIAKAKPLREIDMLAASIKQEEMLKLGVRPKDPGVTVVQEFDEWE